MTTTGSATPRFRAYSRREFLAAAGGAAAWSVTVVPRHVLGGTEHLPPSERVRVAGIGAGGMGGGDIATHARNGADIVALCDVDDQRAAGSFAAFPKAARYKDFRQMFGKASSNPLGNLGKLAATRFSITSYDNLHGYSGELG